MVKINQFEIYLVDLNPTKGSEINKMRPCIVISPNEINHAIKTIIIAPMTSQIRTYVTRVMVNFNNKEGQVALDQIRTVDKIRLVKKLGKVDEPTAKKISLLLQEMFAYESFH